MYNPCSTLVFYVLIHYLRRGSSCAEFLSRNSFHFASSSRRSAKFPSGPESPVCSATAKGRRRPQQRTQRTLGKCCHHIVWVFGQDIAFGGELDQFALTAWTSM